MRVCQVVIIRLISWAKKDHLLSKNKAVGLLIIFFLLVDMYSLELLLLSVQPSQQALLCKEARTSLISDHKFMR